MRALIQRVKEAQVTVEGNVVGKIGEGLLVFLGVHTKDTEDMIPWLVEKVIHLRIFEDEAGKMNRSVKDIRGEVLVVSQFTLYGNCSAGRRPSFIETMPPDQAKEMYQAFVGRVKELLGKAETGEFGALMEISLLNHGPATFLIEK